MAFRKGAWGVVALAAAATIALSSCSGGAPAASSSSSSDAVAGEITFLTNRTDLQENGTWDKYVAEFEKVYPEATVKVEGISNYVDDVRTRMSTPNGYGDVLGILQTVPADQFSQFFEPLGKTADMEATYRFLAPASYDGAQYGLAAYGGNARGVLYNTKVWADAGITSLPKSSEEFLADLKLIKEKTGATPYYTNYKDGWPLGSQWFANVGAISGDPDAQNTMAHTAAPWTSGNDVYVVDSLLYDIVHDGLSEADPLTTNWEQSKSDLVTGKIGAMVLGSWAISQFQAAAKDAGVDPGVVGYMAWPATAPDGKQYATTDGGYSLAINKNSEHKAAARAWIDWLIEKSGLSDTQGTISPLKDAALPANLQSLTENNVELLELSLPPAGEEGLLNSIADKSKVDVMGNLYRQKLVDVARGQASGDKDSYFAELNKQWGAAVAKLGG